MTVEQALQVGRAQLTSETAALDAEVLLGYAAAESRSTLLARAEYSLSLAVQVVYETLLAERAQGIPVAYLTGQKEFLGRSFMVSADVLVPRPETESLVEHVLEDLSSSDSVLDIGTGSGCVAISVALANPHASVLATEVSAAALEIARSNAEALKASVSFTEADLLSEVNLPDAKQTVVVANLPYVPDADYQALPDLRHEPAMALKGGPDGLEVIRRFLGQCVDRAFKPRALWLEIDPSQVVALRSLAWGEVTVVPDLAGRDRFLRIAA